MKKAKILYFFLLVALISSFIAANAAENRSYFPLAVGNEWLYQRTGQFIGERKVLINVTSRMLPVGGGPFFYKLNNYNGEAHWVRNSAEGAVIEYPGYLWYLLNAEVGSSWKMQIDEKVPGVIPGSNGAVLTVVSRNEVVRVPAGVFQAVHIRFQTNVADAGITDEWFAPGVGLIKRVESSFAGPVVMELVCAVIDGDVIENPKVEISVTTDKPVYWENHMPGPGPIPAYGPEIKILCTVKPIYGIDTTLNFTDYDIWDVTITNPEGKIVWRNPKVTAPSPIGGINRTFSVKGETTVFSLRLPYGSMEGKYKVTARLLVSSNPPPEAVTYFEYLWAY